jgi:hypothetical protein
MESEVIVFRSGTECKFFVSGAVEEVNKVNKREEEVCGRLIHYVQIFV